MNEEEIQTEFSWLNFSKKILFILVFLAPIFFLPLTLYPVSFNQQSLTLILAALMLGGTTFYLITKGGLELPKIFTTKSLIKLPIWYLLLVFIVALVNSLMLSRAFSSSLWGIDGSEHGTFISFLSAIILLVASSIILKSNRDFRKLISTVIVSVIVVFLIFLVANIFQAIFKKPLLGFFFNGFNTIGTMGMFSAFLGLGFLAMLIFLKTGIVENNRNKTLLTASLVLIFLTLILISHRPTFIALIFSLALFLVLYIYKNESIQISKLNITVFFIFLFLILNFLRLPIPSPFNFPLEVSLTNSSSFKIAGSSLISSAKNFIFGSGPNTYTYQYLQYKPKDINLSPFWSFDFSAGSSFWLTILPTLGSIATLLLFLFFLSILVRTLQSFVASNEENKNISLTLISLFFYLFMISLFLPFNFILLILFFIFAAALISNSSLLGGDYHMFQFSEATIKNILVSFILISVLVSSLILLVFSVKRYVAYAIFGKAIYSYNTGGSIDNTMSKIALAARLQLNEDFARNLAALWFEKLKSTIASAPSSNIDTVRPKMQEAFNNSTAAMQVAIGLNPLNYLYWTELGGIYERVVTIAPNSDEFAHQSYISAQKLNPHSPALPLSLARIELIRADNNLRNKDTAYKSAEKYIQDAIKLKEDYTDAYLSLSQLYERTGRVNEAIKNIEQRISIDSTNIGLLFQLGYLKYRYGDANGAKDAFINILAINPNYSNAKYFLGLVYDRLGENNKALREFEEILKLNPGNQDIQKIINNLKAGLPAL